MKKKWNIKPFIILIIYSILGIGYLVYTNISKTFYINDLEDFWNEFKQHPNLSDFKYKRSTIIFTENISYIETYENSNDCCIIFYFENGSHDSKYKYQNAILVEMSLSQFYFNENDKVKLKAEYESSYSAGQNTNVFLKNGMVIGE